MTEIRTDTRAAPTRVSSPKKSISDTGPVVVENQSPKEPAHKGQSVSSRITRWFTQAGISHSHDEDFSRDISKKTERRRVIRQQRKLQNLEKILDKALQFCPDNDTAENIDADWFFSFIDMAENIYSSTMQEIWGKIFSVEVNTPGTFSIRTLRTLKELTQRDANIFKTAVALAARKKGEYSPKLIYGYYQKPSFMAFMNLKKSGQINLAEFGLAYPDILSLMDAGLLYSSEIESGELSTKTRTEWRIGSQSLHLSPKRSSLFLNYYKFTPTGAELSKLVSAETKPNYFSKLRAMLQTDFEVV